MGLLVMGSLFRPFPFCGSIDQSIQKLWEIESQEEGGLGLSVEDK